MDHRPYRTTVDRICAIGLSFLLAFTYPNYAFMSSALAAEVILDENGQPMPTTDEFTEDPVTSAQPPAPTSLDFMSEDDALHPATGSESAEEDSQVSDDGRATSFEADKSLSASDPANWFIDGTHVWTPWANRKMTYELDFRSAGTYELTFDVLNHNGKPGWHLPTGYTHFYIDIYLDGRKAGTRQVAASDTQVNAGLIDLIINSAGSHRIELIWRNDRYAPGEQGDANIQYQGISLRKTAASPEESVPSVPSNGTEAVFGGVDSESLQDSGKWRSDGSNIWTPFGNQSLIYDMNIEEAGLYEFQIEVINHNGKPDWHLPSGYGRFLVDVYMDGVKVETLSIQASDTEWQKGSVQTLVAAAGNHQVVFVWRNDVYRPGELGDANIKYKEVRVKRVDPAAHNEAPVAQNQVVILQEDEKVSGSVQAADADLDPLTYHLVSGPLHGTIDLDVNTGEFQYSPDADYNGSDSFSFKARDGTADSNVAVVTLVIEPVEETPPVPGPVDYARVSLDYAMSESGNGTAILEVIDLATITLADLASFRNQTYEHAIFLVPAGNGIEAVYLSSGDFDKIRGDETLLPLVENAVFVIHNHPNGQSLPGPTDFANALMDPYWEGVGTFADGWVSFNSQGIVEEGLTDDVILAQIQSYQNGGLAETEELAQLRQAMNDILVRLDELQTAQAALSGNTDGVLLRSSPSLLINGGESSTNSRVVTLLFSDPGSEVTHAAFAFNSTLNASFGPLQEFSSVMQVTIPNYTGANYINVKLYDASGNVVGWLWDSIVYAKAGMAVNAGGALTNSRDVELTFANAASDVTQVSFAFNNSSESAFGPLQAFSPTMNVRIPNYLGVNYVNARLHDSTGKVVGWLWDSIEYKMPSIQLNSGEASTSSRTLDVSLSDVASNVTQMSLAINGTEESKFGPLQTFTPDFQVTLPNFIGTNFVTVRLHDRNGNIIKWLWQSIQLTAPVPPPNQAPVVSAISHDAVDVDSGTTGLQAYHGTTVTYSGNASDLDGDTLNWQWLYTINGGSEFLFSSGSGTVQDAVFDYTGAPAPLTYEWILRVDDGTETVESRLQIGIIPIPNTPPVSQDQAVDADEDVELPITLSGTDVDGDALSYQIVSLPSNGALACNGANCTYTPNQNFNGTDSFTFQVYDGLEDSGLATVSITVLPINDAPVLNAISHDAVDVESGTAGLQVYEGTTVTYSGSASDLDGDTLNWEWLYTIDGGSEFSYSSGSGVIQDVVFDYTGVGAPKTYEWILRVGDGQETVETTLAVQILPQPAPEPDPTPAPDPDPTPPPSGEFDPWNDMEHLYSFNPKSETGVSDFGYGGTAMAYNPYGDNGNGSLFIVGHDHNQDIYEISIPASGEPTRVLQGPIDVHSRMPNLPDGSNIKVGGLQVILDENGNPILMGTLYVYYDNRRNTESHFMTDSLDLATANFEGVFEVGNLGAGFTAGYMTKVPDEWSSIIGAPYITGQAAISIASRTSSGPSAFGFDPNDLAYGTAALFIPLVYYDLDNPLPGYHYATEITSVVWIGDTVLFFGQNGLGDFCYGSGGTNGDCYDPSNSSKGSHAWPYVANVWGYNVADFVDVMQGLIEPWEVLPIFNASLNDVIPTSSKEISGAAYDEETGRLYLSLYGGSAGPTIHVFDTNKTPAPPDTTPPAISNVLATNVTDRSATIGGAADEAVSIRVEYGFDTNYGNAAENLSFGINPSVILNGLTADAVYHYRVTVKDKAGNETSTGDFTFRTAPPDLTPPTGSGIQALQITFGGSQIQVNSNEPTTVRVEYGLDTNYGSVAQGTGTSSNHMVALSGLTPETTYHYRVILTDEAGNEWTSSDFTFDTLAPPPFLVASLDFNEGSGSTVNGGNGVTGTLNGAAWTAGPNGFDSALSFGGNDYVDLGNLDVISSGTGNNGLTLSAWINIDDVTAIQDSRIISKATGTAEQDHYWMLSTIDSGGQSRLRFRLKTGNTTTTLIASSGNLQSQTWTHVAATYDGNTMRLYLDGVEVGSVSKTGLVATHDQVSVFIGDNPGSTRKPWNGMIDEVGVYSQALTQVEIQALMTPPQPDPTPDPAPDPVPNTAPVVSVIGYDAVDVDTSAAGLQVYEGTVVTYSAIASDAEGDTLDWGWTYSIDGGDEILFSNGLGEIQDIVFDYTGVGAPKTYVWTLRVTDGQEIVEQSLTVEVLPQPAPEPDPAPAPEPIPSLVAHFNFDEGSGTSVNGGGLTGTISGASWVDGQSGYGKALYFDGINDWVTINDTAALDLTDEMTLMAWVKPELIDDEWRTIILKETSNGLAYSLYGSGPGQRQSSYINFGGGDQGTESSGQAVNLNEWSHLAATFDGGNLILYVNGIEANRTARSGNIMTSSQALRIGGNSVWGEYFQGAIDEVQIHNAVLSQSEIQAAMGPGSSPAPDPTPDPDPTPTPEPDPAPAPDPDPTPPPSGEFDPAQMVYEGAFRVPNGSSDQTSFSYTWRGLAYNPMSDTLRLTGHDWYQRAAEISIPTPGTGSTGSLPTAQLIQNFADPSDGKGSQVDPDGGNIKVGDYLIDDFDGDGDLEVITTHYTYYDGNGNANKAWTLSSTLNLSNGSDAIGPFAPQGISAGFVAGYMAAVPDSMQSILGTEYVSGQCCISIISRTSYGAALFGVDFASMVSNPNPSVPVPTTPLINYDQNNTPFNFTGAFSLTNPFNAVTEITGVFFDESSQSVIFVGDQGLGQVCYKETCDYSTGGYGVIGGRFETMMWVYQASDLEKVKNGILQPWEVRPSAVHQIDLPGSGSSSIGGVAVDAASGRVFITQKYADSSRPVIHVYNIGEGLPPQPEPDPDPTPDPEPTPDPDPDPAPQPDPSVGWNYDNPEPLPAPTGSVVNVSTVSELVNAVSNLQSGQTIMLAAGTYNLSGTLYIPQGINDWAVRGATGNRDDVIIQGNGMNGSVQFGFWIGASPNGTLADFTLRDIREHGVIANPGAHDMLYHNLHMIDIGDQFIKSNPNGFGNGNDNGIVRYSIFEYTTHENGGGAVAGYTNGVDVHGGDNWIIHHNLFRNFLHAPGAGIAGPAILMWNGSTGTIVDSNTFINNARDISLGLINNTSGNDHEGGIISNNFSYRDPNPSSTIDVSIYVADSPNTKIYHNTIYTNGTYPNAIEYRFSSSTGIDIQNNLLDAGIQARDGASATLLNNVTSVTEACFEDLTAWNFHLSVTCSLAIDQGGVLSDILYDFDGQLRGSNPDLGADEL